MGMGHGPLKIRTLLSLLLPAGGFLIAATILGAPVEHAVMGTILACVGACALVPEPKGTET